MTQSSRTFEPKPEQLEPRAPLTLMEYSESSFTDPHTVVDFDDPRFDEEAYSHIGKVYEGVEPHRMGGHRVTQTNPQQCLHHFDPTYRDFFVVLLHKRTLLQTLCISTRFFAGNPASDLVLTIFDDLHKQEQTIELSALQPDHEHWLSELSMHATRIALHFRAGGITRIWAYGPQADHQPKELSWLSKDSEVVFDEDDFFGGPNFALSHKADRSNQHMLGWETSRSAMGLQAVFPIQRGIVREVIIDTYRHVNNPLRSAWVFGANLPNGDVPREENCPLWYVTSSDGQKATTNDIRSFFAKRTEIKNQPTYTIEAKGNDVWKLETTFHLHQDALHVQADLSFEATHICIMLLPHGGLHAIRVMGDTWND